MVSAVPDIVKMETFVRGASIESIMDANEKVDNCLKAGALAIGCKLKIVTIPGYLPIKNNQELQDLYLSNLKNNYNEKDIIIDNHSGGSTDMGDVSNLIPSIHPYVGGCIGSSNHANDMVVENYDLSVIESGRMMAHTIIDLLGNNAENAKKIKNQFEPSFDRKSYLSFLRSLSKEDEFKF